MNDVEEVIVKTPLQGREIVVGLQGERYKMAVYSGRPAYTPVYDERALNLISAIAEERIALEWDFPVLLTGGRGSGKSMLAQRVARTHDPNLKLDAIIFEAKQFAERFQNNPPGAQIIVDESVWGMYAAEWMSRLQVYFVKILDIGRAKRQIVYFLTPDRHHLNKKIRDDIPQLWLHVTAPKGIRGWCEVRTVDRDNPFYGTWWKPYFAFTFTACKDEFWQRYETKKSEFLSYATDYKKQMRADNLMDQVIRNLTTMKYSTTQIGKILGVSQPTVSRHQKLIRMVDDSQ